MPIKHIRIRPFQEEKALKSPWTYNGQSIEPPDAPEQLLFPRDAKKLTGALAQLGVK